MSGARKPLWMLAAVLLCAASAIELVFLARVVFSEDEAASAADAGRDRRGAVGGDATPAGGGRRAPLPETERVDRASAAPGTSAEIDVLFQERLSARREEKRERFIDALTLRIEDESGRRLSPAERGELTAACRAYFAAVEERDPGDPPGDRARRLEAATRARLAALAQILGSEDEAARVLEVAMYAQVAP